MSLGYTADLSYDDTFVESLDAPNIQVRIHNQDNFVIKYHGEELVYNMDIGRLTYMSHSGAAAFLAADVAYFNTYWFLKDMLLRLARAGDNSQRTAAELIRVQDHNGVKKFSWNW